MKHKRPNEKPVIDYPCTWAYTVIGADPEAVCAAIAEVFDQRDYAAAPSKTSRTGKYCSYVVELTVVDEADRNALYAAINTQNDVVMVI
ncbi:MAG: YbeD family protein [Planctomycetota bacterium]